MLWFAALLSGPFLPREVEGPDSDDDDALGGTLGLEELPAAALDRGEAPRRCPVDGREDAMKLLTARAGGVTEVAPQGTNE